MQNQTVSSANDSSTSAPVDPDMIHKFANAKESVGRTIESAADDLLTNGPQKGALATATLALAGMMVGAGTALREGSVLVSVGKGLSTTARKPVFLLALAGLGAGIFLLNGKRSRRSFHF